MSIKQKFKSVWNKITGKTNKKTCNDGCGCGDDCGCGNRGKGKKDAELGADEVIEEEVFPKKRKKSAAAAKKKPAKKRTRPTNPNYTMIDPSDDTFDAGKS